ncbi:MAG: isoleucine--tRNA ligase [Gammaproteobacteria bacterium]|nr:isoleucine--tRNA ligase [Gammaproteobacteria bacterium]
MANGYRDTLNLPKTEFPMRANLAKREPEILQRWQKIDLYKQLRSRRAGCEKFILHDGPPYANGAIHLGHAVNKTLKDIVVKSRTLSGFDAPYIPGWDCHGLPIELNVEKKKGRPGGKLTAREFRDACRHYASSQVALQSKAFQRLGITGDWEQPYLTMSPQYEANIIRSLAQTMANGHLSRGFRPVHWCFACRSALAEAEVEYRDKASPSMDVRFRLSADNDVAQRFGLSEPLTQAVSLLIWTTTSWTLPVNRAVAVHETLPYALVKLKDEIIIVAESLLEPLLERCGIDEHTILAHVEGKQLEGLVLRHPFLPYEVPLVLSDHVTTDAGTGCVHIAPPHGLDDYQVGLKYHLSTQTPVGANGRFAEETPWVGGESIRDVDDKIISVLKEHDTLFYVDTMTHSYPHCWRHKKPLVFLATPQWFISMTKAGLMEKTDAAVKAVEWIPQKNERRIKAMLEGRPDWCISRQRTWGVPIALFLHKKTHEPHPDSLALMEKVAQRVEQDGIEAWHELEVVELLGDEADDYCKSQDVLDVWFDSGVSHQAVMRQNSALAFPADLYLEGVDQYRGWLQTSLLTSCAMNGVSPYRQTLTHGFTIDSEGRKMSKSIGNIIAPDTIINKMGADVLRLWIAATDYYNEIVCSDEVFDRTIELYRRIRNTARFLLANIDDFNPLEHSVAVDKMVALDLWATMRARQLQHEITEAYDHYHFHRVVQKIHHFCAMEMGRFYLDIIKDRQYTTPKNSLARRSAQTAMFHLLETLVRWLAPICPFTAEEIWQHMPGERDESVLLAVWYERFPIVEKPLLSLDEWQQVIAVREAANKAIETCRSEGGVGSSLETEVKLYADDKLYALLEKLAPELRFLLITSEATLLPLLQGGTAQETDIAGLRLEVTASVQLKCERCWQRCVDVGESDEHPAICQRCITNLTSEGEERRYA